MNAPQTTRALWIAAKETAQMRDTPYDVGPDNLQIKTLFSGISKGTETLVFTGRVPVQEHDTMRAPFQEGTFSFPVKYGYSAVGRVQDGPRKGSIVFALFPHQAHFCLPADAVIDVPENVPAHRAILAANMETALNIIWDAGVCAGDKVAVVGCGVVGALVGALCAKMPATSVQIIDIDASRAPLADVLGAGFATPDQAVGDMDVVIHASASSAGLNTALSIAGDEAKIVEASWYGTHTTDVALGGRFHQRRLQIISSQVGKIPPHKAPRWTYRRRLSTALSLLSDPMFDALISGETAFDELPDRYASILGDTQTLCHRVRYGD